MEKIKEGIIGCGFIASRKHLPGMTRLEGFEGFAFCDLILENSIEHESLILSVKEGFGKAVGFLKDVLLTVQPSAMWWA